MSKASIGTVIKNERVVSEGATYNYTLMMNESNKVASYKLPLYSIEIEMTDEEKIDFVTEHLHQKQKK